MPKKEEFDWSWVPVNIPTGLNESIHLIWETSQGIMEFSSYLIWILVPPILHIIRLFEEMMDHINLGPPVEWWKLLENNCLIVSLLTCSYFNKNTIWTNKRIKTFHFGMGCTKKKFPIFGSILCLMSVLVTEFGHLCWPDLWGWLEMRKDPFIEWVLFTVSVLPDML